MVPFRAAMNRVLDEEPLAALGIAPTQGQAKLRQAIAKLDGVEPNRILVLSGAQEGIDLLARCLIEPGDYAVVERPTFPGAIQSLRAAGARLLQWEAGLWSAEQLERLIIGYSPKLIFTMPTFHNPTGQTMSRDQREAVLDLAARYGVPIVEDDVYSRSTLGVPVPSSLRDLDKRNGVIYISTFSKVFAPGLRLGWLVASPHMVKQLSLIKMRANLFTEGLQQLALASMIRDGSFESHVNTLRKAHAALRSTAIRALEGNFTYGELEWLVPHGGLYIWCRAKKPAAVEPALLHAEELGVTVAPGRAFFADDPDDNCFRLCFTSLDAADLHDAIAILAKSWHLGQL